MTVMTIWLKTTGSKKIKIRCALMNRSQ